MNNELHLQYVRLIAELTEAVVRMTTSKTAITYEDMKVQTMVIIRSNEPLTESDRMPTAIVPNDSQKTNRYLDQ